MKMLAKFTQFWHQICVCQLNRLQTEWCLIQIGSEHSERRLSVQHVSVCVCVCVCVCDAFWRRTGWRSGRWILLNSLNDQCKKQTSYWRLLLGTNFRCWSVILRCKMSLKWLWLTNFMEQSSSWEVNWFSASQEIPCILWYPKVHYHIHKRLPPVSFLSQISPVHATCPTFWWSILILSSHLCLSLPSGLFPSVFSTKTLYAQQVWHWY